MDESGEPDAISDEDPENRFRLLAKRVEADDSLMAIVSHDINSAISSTVGLLTLLLGADSANLTRRQRNIIETLKRSATNQQELIENITTISRIQRGRLKLDLSILETDKLLKDAYEKFEGMAGEKNVELAIAGGESALINADSDLALMALSKIITNAIWFTPSGGKVELSTRISGSGAVLIVTDTGAGIEPERFRNIFDLSKR
ncbi:MAG TPA: HAMP domain-containing histidine kinase, partial [Nitrospirae bacterium]|nr:HAMP domain-containing histidine kinase [Nitrospirota bacterium]